MAIRVAINGFGRIGRGVLRAAWGDPELEFVYINDLTNDTVLAHLLQVDSVHGRFAHQVEAVDGGIAIDGTLVRTGAERDPARLPWRELEVDVVLECTGRFRDRATAGTHLEAGARKVIVSAPAKGEDATIVVGVNHDQLDPDRHRLVSNASCTTNCLAPVARVLHETFGIERGLMTTVHSYTMDQNILDAPHKDLRRARAAAVNLVPTTTGAARAVGLVLPELVGRLNGMAVRTPTPDGSLVDLVVQLGRDASPEDVNDALRTAAEGPLRGILQVSDAPLVSTDIVGNPHSSIVDAPLTDTVGGGLVKVLSWYDNETGFSHRMVDLVRLLFGRDRR